MKIQAAIPTPPEVFVLFDLLKAEDPATSLFMVGGCVRDYLWNQFHNNSANFVPKDIDLTTNLSEGEILERLNSECARKAGVRVQEKESVDTFGVVFVSIQGSPTYEIAPFRKDLGSKDGRRPETVVRGTIHDDAMRRDLTINNLYYDFQEGHILDFNPDGQGIEDVRNRVARFVGDPFERIEEDKLRVLRFVRFFSRLNSGSVVAVTDQRTLEAIAKFKRLLEFKGMSPERIQTEFVTGLKQSLDTASYLQNLADLDLFAAIFPDMEINMSVIPKLRHIKNPKVVLSRLLDQNDNVPSSLNAAKYPNEISDPVGFLISAQKFDPDDAVNVLKNRDKRLIKAKNRDLLIEEIEQNVLISNENKRDLALLCSTLDDDRRISILRHLMDYQPVVPDGNQLMEMGLKGREIGDHQREVMQRSYSESLRSHLA